jgi:hypothetical protein
MGIYPGTGFFARLIGGARILPLNQQRAIWMDDLPALERIFPASCKNLNPHQLVVRCNRPGPVPVMRLFSGQNGLSCQ